MVFNTDKCTVMHIGIRNQPGKTYYMESHKLQECHEEKDLGVLVSDDLKLGLNVTRLSRRLTGCLVY